MASLIDSNVLLDVLSADQQWLEWSRAQLNAAAARGPLLINDVVLAEISLHFPDLAAMRAMVKHTALVLTPMPEAALFLAGRAFRDYRRRGGLRTGVLPDFFIGAQAIVLRLPLLTRDRARYATSFPGIELIAPPG